MILVAAMFKGVAYKVVQSASTKSNNSNEAATGQREDAEEWTAASSVGRPSACTLEQAGNLVDNFFPFAPH